MSASTSRRYPPELRERAVRMVGEIRADHDSEWAAMAQVAELLGVGTPETVRKWCRRAEVDAGQLPGGHVGGVCGTAAIEAGERGVEASQCDLAQRLGFLRGRARPATAMIVRYIDEHVGQRTEGLRWGVESICALTQLGAKIAPSTYYEHRGRTPTAREIRDEELKSLIVTVHADHYGVFGARKVWLTLNRQRAEGAPPIARCTVERLMGDLGLHGAVRGTVKRTTVSDPGSVSSDSLRPAPRRSRRGRICGVQRR